MYEKCTKKVCLCVCVGGGGGWGGRVGGVLHLFKIHFNPFVGRKTIACFKTIQVKELTAFSYH